MTLSNVTDTFHDCDYRMLSWNLEWWWQKEKLIDTDKIKITDLGDNWMSNSLVYNKKYQAYGALNKNDKSIVNNYAIKF